MTSYAELTRLGKIHNLRLSRLQSSNELSKVHVHIYIVAIADISLRKACSTCGPRFLAQAMPLIAHVWHQDHGTGATTIINLIVSLQCRLIPFSQSLFKVNLRSPVSYCDSLSEFKSDATHFAPACAIPPDEKSMRNKFILIWRI